MPTRWLGGKSVVITGAGRGIGRAAAELFAAEGARLLVSDLDGEALAVNKHTVTIKDHQLKGRSVAPRFHH